MRSELNSTRFMALIALVTAILAVAIVAGGRALGAVQFKPFDFTQFTTSLAPLLVIALLIERVIEVFFGVWREPEDRLAEHAADSATAASLSGETAAVADAEVKQAAVAVRKSANTRIAFLAGGALGIVASLAGVRILSLLVDPTTSWGSAGPSRWWTLLDVFLTAGLLGGGADAFHHITSALSSFFTTTQLKAKTTATVSRLRALTPAALPNGRQIVAVELPPP